MNRTYRVVWSTSRRAFIVASEFAKSAGKCASSPKPKTLKSAIALAVGALCAPGVYAAGGCPATGLNTISSTVTTTACILLPGDSVVVTSTGVIEPEVAGVLVTSGTSGNSSVTNSGTISAIAPDGVGIRIDGNSNMVGNVLNNTTGLITGAVTGILLDHGTLTGSITNDGSISAQDGGITLHTSNITGAIINNVGGVISSGNSGITANSSVISSITNSGLIEGDNGAIALTSSTISSGITNSGTITVSDSTGNGLTLASSTLSGGIVNNGTISAGLDSGEGVYLSNSTADNISNSGYIVGQTQGISIDNSSVTGSIINSGTIYGETNGIDIDAGSIGDNINNTGTISGDENGIHIDAGTIGGNINNNGTISGGAGAGNDHDGINIDNGTTIVGSINNTSVITGGSDGVNIIDSEVTGGITNSGSITAGSGLNIQNSTLGSINNSGLIATSGTSGYAINISNGNTVTGAIINSGTVSASGYAAIAAFYSSTITGGITNSGTVENASNRGIAIGSQSSVAGGITNALGGVINANAGIQVTNSAVTGGVANAGTITGASTGIVIYSASVVSGGVSNTGLINITGGSSSATGIYAGGGTLSGGINNSGVISASQSGSTSSAKANGIYFSGLNFSGGITNSGTITALASGGSSALSFGLRLDGNVMDGNISNSGTISTGLVAPSTGQSAGIRLHDSTLTGTIQNSGLIESGDTGIDVRGSTVTGSITNNGAIYGNNVAINVENAVLLGSIDNAGILATGSISGSDYAGTGEAIDLSGVNIAGGITNSGTLFGQIYLSNSIVESNIRNIGIINANGEGDDGIQIDAATEIQSAIINSGMITASGNGIAVDASSSIVEGITNSGTIIGNDDGVTVETHGHVDGGIHNDGTISGGDRGIYVSSTIAGGIDNSGVISGGDTGIVDSGTLSGGISNSGTISGGSHGIYLYGTLTGNINNTGLIQSENDSAILAYYSTTIIGDVVNGSTGTLAGKNGFEITESGLITGGIFNHGVISGAEYGIYANSESTISGGITNSGTITGTDNDGIAITSTSTVTGGIANSGVITAANIGINISDARIDGSIENTGTITGSGEAGISLDSSTVSGSVINGVGGVVDGGQYGLNVDGTDLVSIVNQGNISGDELGVVLQSGIAIAEGISNAGTIAGGIQGVLIKDTSVVTGGIVNSGNIVGGEVGLLIESNSTLAGGLTNSGAIIGENDIGLDLRNQNTIGGDLISSGTITGKNIGLHIDSGAVVQGSIQNTGTINSSEGTGILLDNSSITGGLVNATGSVITAHDFGINVANTDLTTLSNGGNITATVQAGILVGASNVASDFANTGTIVGGTRGMLVAHSVISGGGISNSGRIVGNTGDGLVIQTNSTVAGGLTNSGAIIGTAGVGFGLENLNTLAGNIANSGTISGSEHGVYIANDAGFSGSITNNGSIIGGIYLRTDASGLSNSNLISGGYAAVDIADNTIGSSLANSGSIAGTAFGVFVRSSSVEGGIVNSGRITSDGAGIVVASSSTIAGSLTNTGAIIAANGNGFELKSLSTLTGDVINSGTISGADTDSIIVLAPGSVGRTGARIARSPAPSSGDTGIHIAEGSVFSGAVNNTGTIIGGIYLQADSSGFTNTGIVDGSQHGFDFEGGELGSVNNAGTIASDEAAVRIASGNITGGVVNNGTIAGGNYGIHLISSAIAGGLTTSGTISGAEFSIQADDASSIDSITIIGNNTAKFVGTVDSALTPTQVASDAVYTMDDGQLFIVSNFTNNGVLVFGAGSTGTVDGNYTQSADATFRTHITNDTTYGKLVVTGTATLPSNAKIDVDVSDPHFRFTTRRMEDIISAGTLVSDGTFALTDNSFLFDFSAVLDGNTVDLALEANAPTGVETTVNSLGNSPASGAARVLDNEFLNNPDSPLIPYFITATTQQEVSDAVSQTLPLMTGGTSLASTSAMTSISRVVQARIESDRGLSSGDEATYGNRVFWLKPFGSWADQDSRTGAPGFEVDTKGLALGADVVMSDETRLGASFAYATAEVDSDSDIADQSADIDVYQLIVYGSYNVAQQADLNFHVGVGQNQNDGSRFMSLGGFSGMAESKYDSLTANAGVGFGKIYAINEQLHVTPSVRADYTWIRDESYDEKGNTDIAPLLLSVDERKYDEFVLGADGKLSYQTQSGFILAANLGVGYDVINDDAAITAAYAGAPGASFVTHGVEPSPWIMRGGLGISSTTASGMEISVRYELETRTDFMNQTAAVKVRLPF